MLGLLALGLLIAALAGAFSSGDKERSGQGSSSGAAGPSGLAAGGTALLPPPADGLKPLVGKTAQADDVVVQSVVQNADNPDAIEGFWVGSSRKDRVYVEWGGTWEPTRATSAPRWASTSA